MRTNVSVGSSCIRVCFIFKYTVYYTLIISFFPVKTTNFSCSLLFCFIHTYKSLCLKDYFV